jgi:para-aminobenzoate synthetase component 1
MNDCVNKKISFVFIIDFELELPLIFILSNANAPDYLQNQNKYVNSDYRNCHNYRDYHDDSDKCDYYYSNECDNSDYRDKCDYRDKFFKFDKHERYKKNKKYDGNILLKYNIDGFKNFDENRALHDLHDLTAMQKVWDNKYMKKLPINFETYNNSFKLVTDEQKKGNSYLLNLTFKTPVEIGNFSLEEIFYLSSAKYKLYFKKDAYEFIVFSPESFINIDENNRIFTYPVKGTIDAKLRNAENILMDDDKELAEHLTVVDLLRNDLNIISSDVKVNKFRYIEKINTNSGLLLQTVSEIEGKLKNDYINKFGDIFLSLLPAGSVSGAPKDKTLEIIKLAELERRGYYSGVFGYYDGIKNCLKSSVMIRFIENKNNKLYYRSGGGITVYSSALKEYNEMIRKIYVPIYRNS